MDEHSSKVRINVVVDDERFDAVKEALTESGVEIDEEQRTIGTVAGRVGSDQVDEIARLDGVLAVEPEETIQLPPPESDLQ